MRSRLRREWNDCRHLALEPQTAASDDERIRYDFCRSAWQATLWTPPPLLDHELGQSAEDPRFFLGRKSVMKERALGTRVRQLPRMLFEPVGDRAEGYAEEHRGSVDPWIHPLWAEHFEAKLLAVEEDMSGIDFDDGVSAAVNLAREQIRGVEEPGED